jgi:tRNA threonylcarbamoyladenosine biosynthesis protein TsaB
MSGRLLVIDTAGPVVGVAAFVGKEAVHLASERIVNGADGWLLPEVGRALAALGNLDRVAVSVGPGAFTGLRVGFASALGVAVARGVPVAGVCSLALRAAAAPGEPRVLAWLDARKGRVYAASFDTRGPVPVALDAAVDVAPDVAAAGAPALATGEGAAVYGALLAAAGHRVCETAAESPVAHACALAWAAPAVAPGDLALVYVRAPDAVPTAERGGARG